MLNSHKLIYLLNILDDKAFLFFIDRIGAKKFIDLDKNKIPKQFSKNEIKDMIALCDLIIEDMPHLKLKMI